MRTDKVARAACSRSWAAVDTCILRAFMHAANVAARSHCSARAGGLLREWNPGALAPEAGIVPLDQAASCGSIPIVRRHGAGLGGSGSSAQETRLPRSVHPATTAGACITRQAWCRLCPCARRRPAIPHPSHTQRLAQGRSPRFGINWLETSGESHGHLSSHHCKRQGQTEKRGERERERWR